MQLMRAFDDLLPNFEYTEIFQINFLSDSYTELKGTYDLIDLYCQHPTCACHKVTILVYNSYNRVVATITYGWKPTSYYQRCGIHKMTAEALTQGYLDPHGLQSEYSCILLRAFTQMLDQEPRFIKRIKKRYAIFKKAVATNTKTLPDNIIPIGQLS